MKSNIPSKQLTEAQILWAYFILLTFSEKNKNKSLEALKTGTCISYLFDDYVRKVY